MQAFTYYKSSLVWVAHHLLGWPFTFHLGDNGKCPRGTLLTVGATRVGRTLLPFPPEQQSEPATSLLPIKVVLKY